MAYLPASYLLRAFAAISPLFGVVLSAATPSPKTPLYLTPKVVLRHGPNGELIRLSSRGNLKVITTFNMDGTTNTVQDNLGRKKVYDYDGHKHVIRIHRGIVVPNGEFKERQEDESFFMYTADGSVQLRTGSKFQVVSLRMHPPRPHLQRVFFERVAPPIGPDIDDDDPNYFWSYDDT